MTLNNFSSNVPGTLSVNNVTTSNPLTILPTPLTIISPLLLKRQRKTPSTVTDTILVI